jgi:hypothetical protein
MTSKTRIQFGIGYLTARTSLAILSTFGYTCSKSLVDTKIILLLTVNDLTTRQTLAGNAAFLIRLCSVVQLQGVSQSGQSSTLLYNPCYT